MDEKTHRPWLDPLALQPLYEINARCIEMLVQMAARLHTQTAPFALVHQLRDELRSIDASTRRRAAQCPFLLVDFQFRNPDWWQSAQRHAARGGAGTPQRAAVPRKTALPLARATLVLAWHTVRSDQEAACVSLGLSSAVGRAITALTLEEVDKLAERQFHLLRPRWHDRVATWRALLLAAQGSDASHIRNFRLHGIQLLGSELISHCP